jgi:hypothetical protein
MREDMRKKLARIAAAEEKLSRKPFCQRHRRTHGGECPECLQESNNEARKRDRKPPNGKGP